MRMIVSPSPSSVKTFYSKVVPYERTEPGGIIPNLFRYETLLRNVYSYRAEATTVPVPMLEP
ncbi:MAG TPA: hypothetical protein VEC01_01840 [Noviherbaspirillum sp.]|uniref:hypothetical protein n=1 Tax=Noviherbaspirillum sp. TaxID=1926288 RepID=UPI002D34FB9A|nr:hypothetical protein [Noviherbaspirillum sp.]HYD94038.1 hypothetical protein [Noviherbaspirillum sp.]